jgi:hypothetical protein
MATYKAEQVLNMLDDFDEEVFSLASSDDSCEEDEIDAVEIRLDNEDDENEEEEEDEDNFRIPATPKEPITPSMIRSETFEMYDFTLNTGMKLILGRYNKKKSNVLFSWYRKHNKEYHPSFENKSRIFPEISNEFKIESFFKLIITPEIVQEIADNTNIRIKLIDCTHMNNDKYKKQKERQFKNLVSTNEIYAFIGVLLLLGITKKSHVSINELWSEDSIHFAEFAAAAFSRERFQLIAQNITFDNISNSV